MLTNTRSSVNLRLVFLLAFIAAFFSSFAFAQGYPSTAKESRTTFEAPTVQYLPNQRAGAEVVVNQYLELIGTDTVDSTSNNYTITAASHLAKKGDVLRFTSGTYSGFRFTVISTTTNTIVTGQTNEGAWSPGDSFQILRYRDAVVDSSGSLNVNVTGGASNTQYADGTVAATPTGTEINWNDAGTQRAVSAAKPLPVVQTGTPGLPTGAATEATLSTLNGKVTAVNTGAVVLAAGAAQIGSLAANQSTNVAQLAGTTTDTNSGVKSAGTLRIVIATDQPNLTTALNTNIAQMNGVATTMGNGASGTGVQRVTIASDSTGVVSLATGANTIGALTANQSVNTAQMNGVSVLMGNGASGTGAQRITLASDSTGNIATIGTSVTPGQGATLLAKASTTGTHASGDSLIGIAGQVNDTGAVISSTVNRYIPPSLNGQGALAVVIDQRYQSQATTGIIKREDDPHTSLDAGVFVLTVNNEAGTQTAADGDYGIFGTTRKGALYVVVDGTRQTSNATGLLKPEDSAAADADNLVGISAIRRDAPTISAGTAGDYAEVNVSGQGALWQSVTPSIGGGWSVSSQTALSNTKTQVKSGAATFGGYMLYNPNASVTYIQVWDVASGSITVGTTAPTYVIPLPASSGANLEFANGIAHATAINVAATTTPTGSTAQGSAVVGFFLYK